MIRHASEEDTEDWRALRRDGITRFPSAFMLTLEEHDASDPDEDTKRLASSGRFLAFEGGTPVGLAGLNRQWGRMRHRVDIGPFYVSPHVQGTSVATQLMNALVHHAENHGVWQIELSVNEDNARAIAFYTRMGFTQYGRLPNVVFQNGVAEHDLLILRILTHPT